VAIAALVLAVLLAPLGFLLSLVSLGRIRRSRGRRKGTGLALAALVISIVVMIGLGVAAFGLSQGWFQHHNVDDWPSGDEHAIAQVIDRYEELYREGDADAICAELFTEQLREIVETEPDGCGSLLEGRVWYYQHDIEMTQVSVDGDTATTRVLENGVDLRVDLVRVDGEWRISFFTVLEDG